MSSARKFDPITVSDYLAGEKTATHKHEYVGGNVYAKAGASNTHNRIATNVTVLLGSQLRGNPCDVFNSDTKVRIRAKSGMRFFYPDALVVCDANPTEDQFQDQPVVIVEVISQSTRRIDMGEKQESYLQIPSLDTYILLEQSTAAAIVFQRDENGQFQRQSHIGLEANIPLNSVNGELKLSEVYESVDFKEEPEDN